MKSVKPNALARTLVRFFQEYLPTLRGMSTHTIRSYRDGMVLYMRFVSARRHCGIEALNIEHFTAANVEEFLADLERARGNGIPSRNVRLAALHTFARFAASEVPEHLVELQRILATPFKRGSPRVPLEYLDQREVQALLATTARPTPAQERDQALFALMFNTGARVQEALDLKVRDVRLAPPFQVRLNGKGNKIRVCPIWAHTATRLRRLIQRSPWTSEPDNPIFVNLHGAKLTRFGVRYILHKRLAKCAEQLETLKDKRIHPHSLRHTTAIHLLKAGVDFATISQWLGHASLNTTMAYARADIDLKRQALMQVFPDAPRPPRAGKVRLERLDVLGWLRRL
ncbi:MAG: tyrosine-type recombinase/integrase [Burkholderiaceae bacterium]